MKDEVIDCEYSKSLAIIDYFQFRELVGSTAQLISNLIHVIIVYMHVTETNAELPHRERCETGENMSEKSIRSDIERYTKKYISRTLVEVA
jgi:hypothetical protein